MHSTNSFDHEDDNSRDDDSFGTNPQDGPIGNLEPPREIGDFVIKDEIGRGGMGIVYKAHDRQLNRTVALKVLPSAKTSRSSLLRFENEAKAAAAVSHSNIIPVYSVGDASGTPYYAMKLIEGEDLSQTIKEVKRTRNSADTNGQVALTRDQDGRDDLSISSPELDTKSSAGTPADVQPGKSNSNTSGKRGGSNSAGSTVSASLAQDRSTREEATEVARAVARIGKQVASALDCAHASGIVHRDIKPSNLMLDRNGTVWVADFGLASFQDAAALTRTGDVVGTLRYMSPEQATGRRVVDERSDIFSLGITLYELATLEHPYSNSGRDLRQQISFGQVPPVRRSSPKLPAAFETIICRATESNPLHRYQSAQQLAGDLEAFLTDGVVQTRRTPKWKYARDWFYRRPLFTAVSACLLLIMLAAASTGAFTLNRALVVSNADKLRAEASLSDEPVGALGRLLRSHDLAPDALDGYRFYTRLQQLHELGRYSLKDLQPGALTASPDGTHVFKAAAKMIANGGFKGNACIIDLQKGDISPLPVSDEPVSMGAFCTNNRFLLTTSFSKQSNVSSSSEHEAPQAQVLGLKTLPWTNRPLTGTSLYRASSQNFSPDGRQLVVPAKTDGQAWVYQVGQWDHPEVLLRNQHTARVLDSIFSPDGKKIATLDLTGKVVLWNATDGSFLAQTTVFSYGYPLSGGFSFANSSEYLIVQNFAGAQFLSAEDLEPKIKLNEPGLLSPNSQFFVGVAHSKDELFVYDIRTESPPIKIRHGVKQPIVAFGSDNVLCVGSQYQSGIQLIDPTNGETIKELPTRGATVDSIASTRAGEFTSTNWDGTLSHWSLQTDADRRSIALPKPTHLSRGAELDKLASKDGALLIGHIQARKSAVFRTEDGLELTSTLDASTLGFTAEGDLITEEPDGRLALRNSQTLKIKTSTAYSPHPRVAFGSGSKSIWIVSQRGELHRWDITSSAITSRSLVQSPVRDFDFSDAGTLVCLANGTVVGFNLESGGHFESTKAPESANYISVSDNWLAVLSQAGKIYIGPNVKESKLAECEVEGDIITATQDGIAIGNRKSGKLTVVAEGAQIVASREFEGLLNATSFDEQRFAVSTKGGLWAWDWQEDITTRIVDSQVGFVASAENATVALSKTESGLTQVHLLDDSGKQLDDTSLPASRVISMQKSDDRLAVTYRSFDCIYVEQENLSAIRRVLSSPSPISNFSFTADQKPTVAAVSAGNIWLHQLSDDTKASIGKHEHTIVCSAFSNDGKLLVTSDEQGTTCQWDLLSSTKVRTVDFASDAQPLSHHIADNGLNAATVLSGNRIAIWDLRGGPAKIVPVATDIGEAEICPSGRWLIVAGKPQRKRVSRSIAFDTDERLPILIVDTTTGTVTPAGDTASVTTIKCVDNSRAVLLTTNGELLRVDIEQMQTSRVTGKRIQAIRATEGSLVYATTSEGLIAFDVDSGEIKFSHPSATQIPLALAESPMMLIMDDQRRLLQVPRDPMQYARKVVQRILDGSN